MTLIFRDDAYARTCPAVVTAIDERGIRLDNTVFYPTGGGQPGDVGMLRRPAGDIAIVDAIKGAAPDSAMPAIGESVTAEIDWARRHRLMRMHTCLHLLCAVVPGAVTGGQISDGKARLDFDVPGATLDKDEITARLNALIAADHAVTPRWIADEELAAHPELVRTMTVKPPTGQGRVRLLDIGGIDLQPCGGTHVRRTGEIGAVAVAKIENKGKQNRRVNVVFA
jgi:misacylated tRNA(Ala) deacylase